MVKTSGTKFWDTATYSCMGGYRLIGKDSRTCEDTGLWIGEAPICVGQCLLLLYLLLFLLL